MKWILIILGAIVLIPIAIKVLFPILKWIVQLLLRFLGFGIGVVAILLLIRGETLYGIIGLVLAVLAVAFLPKPDFNDINDYI